MPHLWFDYLVFSSSGCFCVPSWRRIKFVPLKRLNCVAVRSKYDYRLTCWSQDGRCFHFFWRHKNFLTNSNSATMTRSCSVRFDGDVDFNRTSKDTYVQSISLTIKSHKHTPLRFIERHIRKYKRLPETDRRLCIDRSHFHRDHNILPKVLYVRKPRLYCQRINWEFNADSFVLKVFIFQDSWGMGVKMNIDCQLTSHHILFLLIFLSSFCD